MINKIKIFLIHNSSGGMTLFIAVTIMSIILFITFAVTNIAVKSTQFASSGKDSQAAFFVADAGVECALYWDSKKDPSRFDPTIPDPRPITCGGKVMSTGQAIAGTTTTACIGSDGLGVPSSDISRVNVASGADNSGSSASSISTNSFNVASGNLIVVAVRWWKLSSQTLSSLTDSAGNVYVKAAGKQPVGSNDQIEIWYAQNTVAASSNVITATFSASTGYRNIAAIQYSGADPAAALDVTAVGDTNSSKTVTSGTFSTSGQKGVIVAAVQASNLTTSWTALNGYTNRVQTQYNVVMMEDKITSAPESNATVSVDNSGVSTIPKGIVVAAFRVASNGVSVCGIPKRTSVFGFNMDGGQNPTQSCAIVTVTKNADGTSYIKSFHQ